MCPQPRLVFSFSNILSTDNLDISAFYLGISLNGISVADFEYFESSFIKERTVKPRNINPSYQTMHLRQTH